VDCSVLVPVLNEERYIEQTLGAMRAQRFDGALEFVFADGGSTDATRSILHACARIDPRVRVFDNPGRTVSSGLNVALGQARGRWVARMDAHTEYSADYLQLGVNRLNAGGTHWVSGPPVPRGNGAVSRGVALALGTGPGRGGSRKWAREEDSVLDEYELDSGVFAGVWERRTLLAYGGWDEGWPCNEDSEMAGRFLGRGERLVCLPAMAAHYVPRETLGSLWRQYRRYGEYRVKTARRHPHTMRRVHLVAPMLVLDAAAAMAGPRLVRHAARLGLGLYAGMLASEGLRSAKRAQIPNDAALVPLVLATMHFAWGVGTFLGVARYGPPLAAVAQAAGLKRMPNARASGAEPVFAPSLRVTPQPGD
jgi:succinoglycan biosynthesis protein ExoA